MGLSKVGVLLLVALCLEVNEKDSVSKREYRRPANFKSTCDTVTKRGFGFQKEWVRRENLTTIGSGRGGALVSREQTERVRKEGLRRTLGLGLNQV